MLPKELDLIANKQESLFFDLQNRLLEDIVRRIKKAGEITATADYQIQKYILLGNSTELLESEIKRLTKLSDAEIYEIYDKVINNEYTRSKATYEQINANFVPFEKNKQMQSWYSAIAKQTRTEMANITKSLGFMVDYGTKKVFTPFATYYQKYLDQACLDIVSGAFDYNTVIRRTVNQLSGSGIVTIDYATGMTRRATVAARSAILTGTNQLATKINDYNAERLGTDTFEITWHSGARADHWWGGMVFPKKQLIEVCGLGTAAGLAGTNCRHNYYAFIPGVSERNYTDEQLRKMNKAENIPRTYKGKQYNAYEATKKQRELERRMQEQRSKINLLKKSKTSDELLMAAKARYLDTLHGYRGFSKAMNIEPQMARVYVDMLGRVI